MCTAVTAANALAGAGALPPAHLTCDLLEHTELVSSNCYPTGLALADFLHDPDHLQAAVICSPAPDFGWVVNDSRNDVLQTAYQIQVAASPEDLQSGRANVWDSGKVLSDDSTAVPFGGRPLGANSIYCWRVRTWHSGDAAAYSVPQMFVTGPHLYAHGTARYPLQKTDEAPKLAVTVTDKISFVDFGRAAFGRIHFQASSPAATVLTVRLGEVAAQNRLNQNPGGSRRFRAIKVPLESGTKIYTLLIPADARNTGKAAIKLPAYAGEVMPFRYCEIEQGDVPVSFAGITRESLHYPFADAAATFHSSDQVLNDLWEFCKYSIKATSFAGTYIDGDRERIPYEADALIDQKCHYAADREFSLARHSAEYLIKNPTWPTEWPLQSIWLAWNDYRFTGNLEFLRKYYADLKAKTLLPLADESGLISTRTGKQSPEFLAGIHLPNGALRDIVDWPQSGSAGVGKSEPGETDGCVFTNINTVVNAYHFHALEQMSQLAAALGKADDAKMYSERAQKVRASFNEKLFAARRGVYVDGIGTDHASLHANMFALAFGLVPETARPGVIKFIESRGMACSVYGAQHLLDGLYQAGAADYAFQLLTTNSPRSWAHMIYDIGTTITLEAWDDQFKTNEDWNHAWGAAPANIIPFQLMGVQPTEPGWRKFQVKPQPSDLKFASLTLPTIRGTIEISLTNQPGKKFVLKMNAPANTVADVYLPVSGSEPMVELDGKKQPPALVGAFIRVPAVGSGTHNLSVIFNHPPVDTPRSTLLGEPASK